MLSRVRIQTQHSDFRVLTANAPHTFRRELDHIQNAGLGQSGHHVLITDMNRHQTANHLGRVKGHA